MTLTLTILRCPETVAPETRKVAGGEFSVGRGPENGWTLADPTRHLSKRHCVFAFRHDTWHVAGTSSNGTFLNGDREPLEAGGPRPVADGDRIKLGPYEIEIGIAADRQRPGRIAEPLDPFGEDPLGASFPSAPPPSFDSGFDTPSVALPATFDPLDPGTDEESFAGLTHADHSPAVTDAFRPQAAHAILPDDWDLDPNAPVPVAPAPAPPLEAAAVPTRDGDLFAAFLRGAGMTEVRADDPAARMEQLGAAFRAIVFGIRQALIARASIKSEFRIGQTMIRPRGNNPLKFSANDEDALAALLGAGRRTDISPEAAVSDALTDMRIHELATMTAMQSAVRALVARFSPEALRSAAERGGLKLLGGGKTRAWDAFEALHGQVSRGLSDDFDSVFGRSFTRAYEQAVAEIEARDKGR